MHAHLAHVHCRGLLQVRSRCVDNVKVVKLAALDGVLLDQLHSVLQCVWWDVIDPLAKGQPQIDVCRAEGVYVEPYIDRQAPPDQVFVLVLVFTLYYRNPSDIDERLVACAGLRCGSNVCQRCMLWALTMYIR
jgi:hypothetical protein